MQFPVEPLGNDPCVLESVQPLLSELGTSIHVDVMDAGHDQRLKAEAFVHHVFARHHRADVQSFFPTLLGFRDRQHTRGVVGFRGGRAQGRLFVEQYLAKPAQAMIGERVGETITRDELVEVGNLALENPGDARWVIAASTCFLHALGYRWVVFTATRMLINAFQRLGLQPLALAFAHPQLLDDKGEPWGDYYRANPVVCAGNIASGYRKLHRYLGRGQPVLRSLLEEMEQQAGRFACPQAPRYGAE